MKVESVSHYSSAGREELPLDKLLNQSVLTSTCFQRCSKCVRSNEAMGRLWTDSASGRYFETKVTPPTGPIECCLQLALPEMNNRLLELKERSERSGGGPPSRTIAGASSTCRQTQASESTFPGKTPN